MEEIKKIHSNKTKNGSNIHYNASGNRSRNGKPRGIVKVSGNRSTIKVPLLNDSNSTNTTILLN